MSLVEYSDEEEGDDGNALNLLRYGDDDDNDNDNDNNNDNKKNNNNSNESDDYDDNNNGLNSNKKRKTNINENTNNDNISNTDKVDNVINNNNSSSSSSSSSSLSSSLPSSSSSSSSQSSVSSSSVSSSSMASSMSSSSHSLLSLLPPRLIEGGSTEVKQRFRSYRSIVDPETGEKVNFYKTLMNQPEFHNPHILDKVGSIYSIRQFDSNFSADIFSTEILNEDLYTSIERQERDKIIADKLLEESRSRPRTIEFALSSHQAMLNRSSSIGTTANLSGSIAASALASSASASSSSSSAAAPLTRKPSKWAPAPASTQDASSSSSSSSAVSSSSSMSYVSAGLPAVFANPQLRAALDRVNSLKK